MARKEEVASGSNGGGPERMSACGMQLSRCRTVLTMVERFFAAWGLRYTPETSSLCGDCDSGLGRGLNEAMG